MKYHKTLNKIPVFNFFKILLDAEKNIKYLYEGYDDLSKIEINIKVSLENKSLLTTFTEIQNEYLALSFTKDQLQDEKTKARVTYLMGKKQCIDSALLVFSNTNNEEAILVLNEFKDFNFKSPITKTITTKIERKSTSLLNKANIEIAKLKNKAKLKSKGLVESDDSNIEKTLDKQSLALETGLELGYKIDPKTTTMIRWLNLNEAYQAKADAINKK
jgi:hypothetical protein